MISRIRILSPQVAARVAAAEVITRPVNVVKELVENSIDAGADHIQVLIQGGGRQSIEVLDNGHGMDSEDLLLSVQKQATSKLSSLEDFMSLSTFGFRGEALPSIAAVARLEVHSILKGRESGSYVTLPDHPGVTFPSSIHKGTRVLVKDLFYNIPARLKFLKAERYEKSLIEDLIHALAAAHPHCSFELSSHGERVFYHNGGQGHQGLLLSIFGPTRATKLLELPKARHPILGFEIEGYLGRPELCRADSRELRILINQRMVNHPALARTVRMAYDSLSEFKKWPIGILRVKVPPPMLDVNVHPQKMEVRIDNEALLEEFLLKQIRQLLLKRDLSPTVIGETAPTRPKVSVATVEREDVDFPLLRLSKPPLATIPSEPQPASSTPKPPTISSRPAPAEAPEGDSLDLKNCRVVGQLQKTLILCERDKEVLLVDQHIAQERVLFETLFEAMVSSGQGLMGQKLLMPLEFTLDSTLCALASEHAPLLARLGFEVDIQDNLIRVLAYPPLLSQGLDQGLLEQMLSSLKPHALTQVVSDYYRDLAATMACRGSIKAGMDLTHEEMQRLLKDLSRCKNPWFCPHGRPIIVKVQGSELFRYFNRHV